MILPKMILLTALAAATYACSVKLPDFDIPRIETGPTETVTISEAPSGGDSPASVTLELGAGKLALSGGAEGLIEGEIQYNVAGWKPELTRDENAVTLSQGDSASHIGLPESAAKVVNDWDLKLGSTPMALAISAGAYEGSLDLSGIPLQRLEISEGASNTEVSFTTPNPAEMETLSYTTGASNVDLIGLAHANFAEMTFEGGAGDYTLDFAGALQREADVQISAGVSKIRIVIPAGTAARVVVTGAAHDVDTQGTWTASDNTYEASGSGPLLTISVEMGVGSLTLVSE